MTPTMSLLIAVDFGSAMDSVVEHATLLARDLDAEVVLLHAVDFMPFEPHLHNAATWPALTAPAREQLEELRTDFENDGVTVRDCLVARGPAADAIVNIAKSEAVNGIVIGAVDKAASEKFLAGTTAERVVRHAEQPVFLHHPTDGCALDRITCAIDYTSHSAATLKTATSLALAHRAELMVIHVVPDEAEVLTRINHDTKRLQEYVRKFHDVGMEIKTTVRVGEAAAEILASLEEGASDLLVIGAHSKVGVRELFVGGTATKVLRRAACSVVVVKERELFPPEQNVE